MTDEDRNELIGSTMLERESLKRKLACLKTKADRMTKAVTDGLNLIQAKATGHMANGRLHVADRPHSNMIKGVDWPSAEQVGELVTERTEAEERLAEIESRLHDMGIRDV